MRCGASEAYSENNDKMKNLAGETKVDLHILKELDEAGIEVIEGERSRGEVPHTLTGKLADWNFSRAWYYWVANSSKRNTGIPLDIAEKLHDKKYKIKGPKEPETYGQVIRVTGHCGCPPPKEWAFPTEEVLDRESKRLGIDWRKTNYGDLSKLCNSGKIKGERFVDNYHIDTQEGLNALAGAIRTLHNMASSGTDPKEIKRLHDRISSLYVEWETSDKQGDVELLKKLPTIEYDGRNVNELLVGIKGGCEVVSIAKVWESTEGRKGVAQHFFEGGQITGFNYGNISGPGQILNRGPEVDERLRPHYEEVKNLRPNAAGSLELCMQELEKPGPEYKQ